MICVNNGNEWDCMLTVLSYNNIILFYLIQIPQCNKLWSGDLHVLVDNFQFIFIFLRSLFDFILSFECMCLHQTWGRVEFRGGSSRRLEKIANRGNCSSG